MRKFRFGVLGESVRDTAGLLTTATRAEELGYSTFLLRDHFVTEPFGDQLSPMPALAAVAMATTKLRLGTLVLANDYRHPVLLAKEAATLQEISGGRFELGIGAGWHRDEYERAGLAFDAAGTRVGRLAEAVPILKSLLDGKEVTADGAHYRIDGLATFPNAATATPILMGSGGPRMLRLAGQTADIVGILPIALPEGAISGALSERSSAAMARKIALVAEGAGSRFDDIELTQILTVHVVDDHREEAERIARTRGWGDGEVVLDMPSKVVGPVDRIVDELLDRRERFGLSYHVVSDTDLERFAPVVALLAGK
ncbi:TIGR03621 family F420-dependent LLM class oxidoreductase [Amycolatopsis sp. CA-230715]|uniref:TIGR03621 family F420-dependent LLM class oxidoreductase n=1 Tax=Amycolatopsis sp. CA-230715 TaxID=2745196 RepID=UPI001C00A976|nr:TIGR03621 family F420-dependent LLM class oxidoreductase [Amycolatopsis sp. CA-230715]QWF83362.1 F420-dependent glucose-6-phosphate dehydrogenase [Amycolatopsis sp. CA-230715]